MTDVLQIQEKKKVERRPLTITPTFDPAVRRWFVDEFPGVEAPTLRELLKRLPKGTKITNYYPDGIMPIKFKRATELSEMRPRVVPTFGYKHKAS